MRSVQKLPEVKLKKKIIGLSKIYLSVLVLGSETSRS